MLNKTRRRFRSPGLWALLLVVGLPALAEAQQTGLFPLRPIKRERVPGPMEDPVFRQYRQAYFGYHPTCWRKFPCGWGCPSPEAPNPAESYRLNPRQPWNNPDANGDKNPNPDDAGTPPRGMGAGNDEAAPANPGGATPNPNIPALPPTIDPFRIEPAAPPARTAPPATSLLEGLPAVAPNRPAPLEPTKPPVISTSLLDGPVEPARTLAALAPTPPAGPRETTAPDGATGPLLALPDPTLLSPSPGVVSLGTPGMPAPSGFVLDPTAATNPDPSAVQPPPRRSVVGGFFNSLFRRR